MTMQETISALAHRLPSHPIDLLIFAAFLILTLLVGMSCGKQTKTLQEYALGGKDFSTPILVVTMVATYSSGSGFIIGVENTYTGALYYVLASVFGIPLSLWLSGRLATRMGEFMNHLSVAEAIGSMYGRTARIITACSSILAKMGYVAVQFKALAKMLEVLFQLDGTVATSVAAGIVILYSASGGVRAVAFTDVFQFLTFGIAIPVLAIVIWGNMKDPSQAVATLANSPTFDLTQVVGGHPEFMAALSLFMYFVVPQIYVPSVFQRIAMAKDPRQAGRMLTYGSGTFLLMKIMIAWIGFLLLADKPGMQKEEIIPYLINHHAYVGLKGLLGAGIMALAMSTADSSLNAISVMFANDIVKPLSGKEEGSILVARLFSIVMGLFALSLALYSKDLLKLLLFSGSFYMPIFAVPMIMAVLGFRTSKRVALASMAAGFATAMLWSFCFNNKNSIPPSMLANLLVLLGAHYLLGEPKGWKKVDPNSPLGREQAASREAWQSRIAAIKSFRLYPYLLQNLPQNQALYFWFGLYAMLAVYSALYTVNPDNVLAYKPLYDAIPYVALCLITAFITLPVWTAFLNLEHLVPFFWPMGIAILLFLLSTLVAIINHFYPMQVIVLMINLAIAISLLHWPLVLALAIGGIAAALLLFQACTGQPIPWSSLDSAQFNALYGLLLFGSLLVTLFRNQHAYDLLDKKNKALKQLQKEHKRRLVALATKMYNTLRSLEDTGVENLLTISRGLQTIQVTKEYQDQMQALQTELLPIAFHLQGIGIKAQDYLRLEIDSIHIKDWCQAIKDSAQQSAMDTPIHCTYNTRHTTLIGDPKQLTTLLNHSVAILQANAQAEERPILIALEDTSLCYALPDVTEDYVRQVRALRIGITTEDQLPELAPSYTPDLVSTTLSDPETSEALDQAANDRIVKAHYGYAAANPTTLIYVIPIDVKEVRHRDMDKRHMELGVAPTRSDDRFKDKQVDAQAQEKAFLQAVETRTKVDIKLVKGAIELIKWYHGPVKRKSGEPFYLHPIAVAHIVLDYNQDEATILGALLHDTVEDTAMVLQHISTVFGPETAEVVDVVTHLQSVPNSLYKIKLTTEENLYMLEKTGNTRGLYVKLADRMHNIRTIGGHKRLEKRQRIAQETMDFFVPLAEQLGLQAAVEEFKERCAAVLRV